MNQTVVGKLNKAFGIKGFIKVIPQDGYISDLKNCDTWFIERGKDRIPYFVESIQEDPHFLIKFEEIDSPEDAKIITGCPISLRDSDINTKVSKEENDLDNLLNFSVEQNGVSLGEIVRIEEFPQQLMAFIANGNIDIMMPLSPDFIIDIDMSGKILKVDLPEGFIESQS